MNHNDIERALSRPRFNRFVNACNGNREQAYELYRLNIRLSFKVFAVISVFEVVFRNAIDSHYKLRFGNEWLYTQSGPYGFLAIKGCEKSRENVVATIHKMGQDYSHDKTVADLNFAFWRNMFASKEFSAGRSTLMSIFTNKSRGEAYNHTYVFNKLSLVSEIRNRIAHHDPICFSPKSNEFSFAPTLTAYESMKEIIHWLDFDPAIILAGVDFVAEEVHYKFK